MTRTLSKSLFVVVMMIFAAGVGSGCVIDPYAADTTLVYEYEYEGRSNLYVDWVVDSSYSASDVCYREGVEYWIIEVDGPESRTIVRDCYTDPWSTDFEFYDLPRGSYSLSVDAYDVLGYRVDRHSSVYFYDDLLLEESLTLDF